MLYVGFFINYVVLPFLSYYFGKKIATDFIGSKSVSVNKKQAIAIGYFIVVFLISCGIASIFVQLQNQGHHDFFVFNINYNSCFMQAVMYAYIFYWQLDQVVTKVEEPPSKNAEQFVLASKIATSIEGFLSAGGKINEKTQISILKNSISISEKSVDNPISSVQMSHVDGFADLLESIKSGFLLRPTIDSYAISVLHHINGKK